MSDYDRRRVCRCFLGVIAAVSLSPGAGATEAVKDYRSKEARYSIRYGGGWSLTSTPEPGVDATLVCKAENCAVGSTITFGVRYNPDLAHAAREEVLASASARPLTASVRASPLVSSVEVHEEGKTKLGSVAAYEVRMTLRLTTGATRVRHTFLTFNRGSWISEAADYGSLPSAARAIWRR